MWSWSRIEQAKHPIAALGEARGNDDRESIPSSGNYPTRCLWRHYASDHRRTVRFVAVCAEECDRCANACPTQAIRLVTEATPASEETVLDFALAACEGCGAPLAPVEMLAHLRAAIPDQVQTDAEGQVWQALCPACRQQGEARQMAREVLLTRWSR